MSRRWKGKGPFTVFAPTNEAFAKLPAGTVDSLLKPENKAELVKILTCHVIAGDVMAKTAMKMIKDDGGKHEVTTRRRLQALAPAVRQHHHRDRRSRRAPPTVTIADVKQSNGVIHVIDAVLLPKM